MNALFKRSGFLGAALFITAMLFSSAAFAVDVADMGITKSAVPATVTAGSATNLIYTITATNYGPDNAANVEIADSLPDKTTFQSVSYAFTGDNPADDADPYNPDSCSPDPVQGNHWDMDCFWADVPPGEIVITLSVTVDADATETVDDATRMTNVAVVATDTDQGADAESDTDSTSTDIDRVSDLSIAKDVDEELVVPGGQLTYTITVTNAGPSYADNVVIKDTLPAGLTPAANPPAADCTWAAPVITCTKAELALTDWVISFTVNVDADQDFGPIKNVVVIDSSDSEDPDGADDEWMSEADSRVVPAIPSDGTAVLAIQKRFSDGNSETPITLTVQCSTGSYSPIGVTMNPDDNDQPWGQYGQYEHIFVIENIALTDGEGATCTVIESPISGYSAEYKCKVDDAMSDADSSCIPQGYEVPEDNYACKWSDVQEGDSNYCLIVNDPDPVTVSVTKVWEVVNMGGDNFTQDVDITLYCQGDMLGDEGSSGGYEYRRFYLSEGDYVDGMKTVTAKVIPDWYPTAVPPAKQKYTKCYAEEDSVASGVEMESDCGSYAAPGMNIAVGMGDSCTITNTMFFEGIPTLNQYGLAIMALLMLGAGFVGFRRFV